MTAKISTQTTLGPAWQLVQRSHSECWAHRTLPLWIVEYEPIEGVRDYPIFHAFIACARLIPGQHPCQGGVDNKRVGDERGFRSIEAAATAAIARAGGVA